MELCYGCQDELTTLKKKCKLCNNTFCKNCTILEDTTFIFIGKRYCLPCWTIVKNLEEDDKKKNDDINYYNEYFNADEVPEEILIEQTKALSINQDSYPQEIPNTQSKQFKSLKNIESSQEKVDIEISDEKIQCSKLPPAHDYYHQQLPYSAPPPQYPVTYPGHMQPAYNNYPDPNMMNNYTHMPSNPYIPYDYNPHSNVPIPYNPNVAANQQYYAPTREFDLSYQNYNPPPAYNNYDPSYNMYQVNPPLDNYYPPANTYITPQAPQYHYPPSPSPQLPSNPLHLPASPSPASPLPPKPIPPSHLPPSPTPPKPTPPKPTPPSHLPPSPTPPKPIPPSHLPPSPSPPKPSPLKPSPSPPKPLPRSPSPPKPSPLKPLPRSPSPVPIVPSHIPNPPPAKFIPPKVNPEYIQPDNKIPPQKPLKKIEDNKAQPLPAPKIQEKVKPPVEDQRATVFIPTNFNKSNPTRIYKLHKKIGKGGFGEVFISQKISTKETFAIKILKPKTSDEKDLIKNEISLTQNSNHQNIIKFYEYFDYTNTIWIIEELMSCSLTDLVLDRPGQIPELVLKYILYEALKGLEYLHKRNRIHRDIKSDNILISDKGAIKVADLGLAAQLNNMRNNRNTFVGTLLWMPPEIIQEENYGTKVDIWALGIVAIELAEGQPPNYKENQQRILKKIVSDRAPELKNSRKWSLEFKDFLSKCLVKDQNRRQSSSELLSNRFFNGVEQCKEEFLEYFNEWSRNR
ncbi:hypothetical protein SteCoe_23956 [Stentor coeruleus]|uniref:non-specific serine/threonine protein kinase n=1 Tax=Stentor coeruleus TaxID=5963 RepID=A0A1R2BIQ1_9CILI|nr:hypothetical protein SteCoe_23956 [Stentor coeruleus]